MLRPPRVAPIGSFLVPILRHDFVLHALRSLSGGVERLTPKRNRLDLRSAQELVRQTCVETLGMEYDVLVRFDAASVAALFSTPEQVRVLARLVDESAALKDAAGDAAGAQGDSSYAWQLITCSRRRFGIARDLQAADRLRAHAGDPPRTT